MAIPTQFDARLGEIDDLAAVVMIRLKTLHRSGGNPESVRTALEQYNDKVLALAGLQE